MRSGPVIHTVAVPLRAPLVAVMTEDPKLTPVTTPVELTVAKAVDALLHVIGPGGVSTSRLIVWPTSTHPAPWRCRITSGAGGTTFTGIALLDFPPAAAVTDAVPSLSARTI